MTEHTPGCDRHHIQDSRFDFQSRMNASTLSQSRTSLHRIRWQLSRVIFTACVASVEDNICVRKSVRGTSEQKPKTENAIRSIDVCDSLAIFLKEFVAGRSSGFLFQSDSGLPLLQSNLLRDWLHKLTVESFHTFRRFRTSTLRKTRVPWDLEKFWIGHANRDVTDKYAEQLKEDVEYWQDWAEKVGLGFILGPSNVVPMKGGDSGHGTRLLDYLRSPATGKGRKRSQT